MSQSSYNPSVSPEAQPESAEVPAIRPSPFVSWWAASAFLGTFNSGTYRRNYVTDRLQAVSLWVTGWSGGSSGNPTLHDKIITKSVQLKHIPGNNTEVHFEFEVTNGPTQVGYHTIDCYTSEP